MWPFAFVTKFVVLRWRACTHYFQTEARPAFGIMPNVLLLVQQGHKSLLNGDRATVGDRAGTKWQNKHQYFEAKCQLWGHQMRTSETFECEFEAVKFSKPHMLKNQECNIYLKVRFEGTMWQSLCSQWRLGPCGMHWQPLQTNKKHSDTKTCCNKVIKIIKVKIDRSGNLTDSVVGEIWVD